MLQCVAVCCSMLQCVTKEPCQRALHSVKRAHYSGKRALPKEPYVLSKNPNTLTTEPYQSAESKGSLKSPILFKKSPIFWQKALYPRCLLFPALLKIGTENFPEKNGTKFCVQRALYPVSVVLWNPPNINSVLLKKEKNPTPRRARYFVKKT